MNIYFAKNGVRQGPYSIEQVVGMIRKGECMMTDMAWREGMGEWKPVEAMPELVDRVIPNLPALEEAGPQSHAGTTTRFVRGVGVITDKVLADFRHLTPELLLPFDEIKSLRFIKDQSLLSFAGIGLFPLLCLSLFDEIKSAYWALAFYFSILWGLFFYRQFPSAQVTRKRALVCFFGTGIVSIALLLFLVKFPPLAKVRDLAGSENLLQRFSCMFAGAAIWEELCKLLMVLAVLRVATEKQTLQTVLFYGLMSGLGFGIYEGVSYQMGINLLADNIGAYYLLNVIRLTSMPFLHAVWTGIAAYFVSLSVFYPERRHGLLVAAVLIPSLLHSLHNTFGGILQFGVDFLSVLALLVYLRQSTAFESRLAGMTTPIPPEAPKTGINNESPTTAIGDCHPNPLVE